MKRPPVSVILALMGLAVAIYYIPHSSLKLAAQQPLRQPTRNPYHDGIAGVGIIEAKEKNRRIDPFYPGRVAEVFVLDGQPCQKGEPLYRLDTDQLESQLRTQEANILANQATLTRLSHLPRPEDVTPAQAQVRAAQAKLQSLQASLTRLEAAASVQAASQDELSTQRFAVQEAQATLDQSRANLAKIKAGSWVYELKEARAQLDVAKEQANQLRVQLEQAVIRAPLTGRVLQMNIRTGQTLSVSDRVAPVLLGRTEPLQVRVDIDEVSASRLTPATPAMASLKGNAQQKFPLRFVRVEPYMIPKQNLTGDSLERVDVRVLQLIYDIAETPDFPIYVGQQVEVFVRHAPRPAARAQAHSEI